MTAKEMSKISSEYYNEALVMVIRRLFCDVPFQIANAIVVMLCSIVYGRPM